MKTILTIFTLLGLAGLLAGSVYAHGGPASANPVNPDDASCMGQLASMHANEGGQKKSVENRPHGGFGGPFDSVKDQMKAFKAFCDGDGGFTPPGSGF